MKFKCLITILYILYRVTGINRLLSVEPFWKQNHSTTASTSLNTFLISPFKYSANWWLFCHARWVPFHIVSGAILLRNTKALVTENSNSMSVETCMFKQAVQNDGISDKSNILWKSTSLKKYRYRLSVPIF